MGLPFNIDRPKVSDEEIKKNQNFDQLVQKFKEQSIKQAKGDESWWKNKYVRYSTIIAGVTVVCTITYNSLFNNQQNEKKKNDSTSTTVNNKPSKPRISPPAASLAVANRSYTVSTNSVHRIKHPSGSQITVPENSFVNSKGEKIFGNVTLEYREFHDLGDIIGSGIPMSYDSAGTRRYLQTAGMFQISGSQNGDPVFIAPGKTLEISLASKTNKPGFHQYVFDTVAGNWKYLGVDVPTAITKENPEKIKQHLKELKTTIEVVIPKKIDSVTTTVNREIKKLPVQKAPVKPKSLDKSKPTFKLDGSYSEFPELAAFNNVIFEVGQENKNYGPEFNEITWSDIKVAQGPQKGLNYLLTLSYRNRTERLIVYPVLTGKDLENASRQYKQRLDEYEIRLAQKDKEEKRLLLELQTKQDQYYADLKIKKEEFDREQQRLQQLLAEQRNAQTMARNSSNEATELVNRIFTIASFGLYNSDHPHPAPVDKVIFPLFIKNNTHPLRPTHVYLIDHTNQTVLNLAWEQAFETKIDSKVDYSFCVFVADKIYISDKQSTTSVLKKNSNKFTVKELEGGSRNPEEFKKSLGI